MTKFIFITGGVVSGIGKGISGASIGRLLKDRGFSIFMQKFDPYLNVNPGNMSPYQHGEVFVTKDGAETDLDLGHYERFIDEELTSRSSITTGKIYSSVIKKERCGKYGGATVQVIPHVTDEIKQAVYDVAEESNADIIITEIGGTIGDIESLPFIEAIRQIHSENPRDDVMFIHTTLVPRIPGSDELKTKPTQHSFKELMSYGIKTDMIITRSDGIITEDIRQKISLFCDVPKEAIVQSENVDLIYEVPLSFKRQGVDEYILNKLNLKSKAEPKTEWRDMVNRFKIADGQLKIGLVGKYTELHDAYLSVGNALMDAGYENGQIVDVEWIDSTILNSENYKNKLANLDGIIVPGGFGKRGLEGMVYASRYCRETNTPYFGISLGMQMGLVDIARNVIGMEDANTTEYDSESAHPVIDLRVNNNGEDVEVGSDLRLGNFECSLLEGSLVRELYGVDTIVERHRHRYEVNNEYLDEFKANGVVMSGINEDLNLVEIIELSDHPFYVGCQFHPELKSRPTKIHPLFDGFIKKSIDNKQSI